LGNIFLFSLDFSNSRSRFRRGLVARKRLLREKGDTVHLPIKDWGYNGFYYRVSSRH